MSHFRKALSLFLVLLFFPWPQWGQGAPRFNFVAIDDIPLEQPVTSIVQDNQGLIWLSTRGSGIYSFDGTNFKVYTHALDEASQIDSNIVHFLYIDSEDRLWAGTNAGLNRYNADADRFDKVVLTSNRDLLPFCNFTKMLEEPTGNLLMSTYEYGIVRLNPKDNFLDVLSPEKEGKNSARALVQDSSGTIFLGTDDGVMVMDKNTGLPIWADTISEQFAQLNQKNIESLLFDEQGKMWIGTSEHGLFRAIIEKGQYWVEKIGITEKKIFSLVDFEDHIVLSAENDGLFLLDANGELIEKYGYSPYDELGVRSNSIWSVFKDRQKRIWLGHFNKGLEVYDRNYNKFNAIRSIPHKNNSLQNMLVTGIEKDNSGLFWISLADGVDIYDPTTKKITNLKGDPNDRYPGLKENLGFQTVYCDSKGNIWLGTWENGIYFLDRKKGRFRNFNVENTNGRLKTNSIRSFSEDPRGRIWIATFFKGLHYYDVSSDTLVHCDSEEFVESGIVNSDIRKILVDSNSNIWVGTSSTLYKLEYQNNQSYRIRDMRYKMTNELFDHPSISQISTLYEASNGTIWIGTDGAGLNYYLPHEDRFYGLNAKVGLEENTVNSIIEQNEDILWVGGKSGIAKIDLRQGKAQQFKKEDGLLSNYFSKSAVEKDDMGNIYFGGNSGINYLNPDSVTLNKQPPTVVLTNFKVLNKSVVPGNSNTLQKVISRTEKVTLNYDQSVFAIDFVGINHTRPKNNQYAYFLEGFDKEWNFVGSNTSATYTNLKPGDYTFKVKASNNDGIWNEEPVSLSISISPPWWKSRQAYAFYSLMAILTLVMGVVLLRKRIHNRQLAILKKQKSKQEKRLQEAKMRFFTNISHEFRTPLTLIINPINDIIAKGGADLPKESKKKLQTIKRNSDRLSKLINELMDYRKLQSNKLSLNVSEVDIVKKTKELASHFTDEAIRRKIDLKVVLPIDSLDVWVDEGMFEKIMFNLLSNAFKVTPEKGEIIVDVKQAFDTDTFQIGVKDTGPGIDQKEYKRIFKRFYQVSSDNKDYHGSSGVGLEMTKAFVELHKGKIDIESVLHEGSKFIVSLPLGKTHFKEEDFKFKADKTEKEVVVVKKPEATIEQHPNDGLAEEQAENSTILVVEDNHELLDYLCDELTDDYTVLRATNGREGMELAQNASPNLIITDVMMPEMDGFELCEKVKTNIATSHIPLLMLTAKSMVEDRIKGIDSGADGYLNKPFDLNVLKAMIVQILESRRILFDKYHDNKTVKSPESTTVMDDQFIKKVLHYINTNLADPNFGVDQLASELFISRSQLYRKIKALTGLTATSFLRKIRLEEAKSILQSEKNYNVSEISYKVGFTSPSYFTKCFKKEYGHLPKEL